MNRFIDFVRTVSRLCGMIAAVLIGLAILVVCQMVLMRYVFGASTVWQTEFVIYSLVAATFLGSPYVLLLRGHVNVDLLPLYLAGRGRKILAFIAYLGGFAFCAVLAGYGFGLFYEAATKGWRTDTIWELPLWIPYLSIPLGIGVLSLQYIADILALANGRDPPFGRTSDQRAGES